jgi:hypothetical protein
MKTSAAVEWGRENEINGFRLNKNEEIYPPNGKMNHSKTTGPKTSSAASSGAPGGARTSETSVFNHFQLVG